MGGLHLDIGVARVGAGRRNAHGKRRPWAFHRAEAFERREHLVAICLQQVDSQVNRRALGQRCPLFRGAWAEGLLIGGNEPLRHVAHHMDRQHGGQITAERLALLRRQRARPMLLLRHDGNGICRKTPDIAKTGQREGARSLAAHAERQRVAAAQHVIDQRADGVPVGGAGEAVGLAPVLERFRSRAVAFEDVGQNVDRRGDAAGEAH